MRDVRIGARVARASEAGVGILPGGIGQAGGVVAAPGRQVRRAGGEADRVLAEALAG